MAGLASNFPFYFQFAAESNVPGTNNGWIKYSCAITGGLLKCGWGQRDTYYVCPNVRNFIDLATLGYPAFSSCDGTVVNLAVIMTCKL